MRLVLEGMRKGAVEAELMIARNHDFVPVRQRSDPIVELHNLLQLSTLGEVAGMYEYITIGYIEFNVGRQ